MLFSFVQDRGTFAISVKPDIKPKGESKVEPDQDSKADFRAGIEVSGVFK